MPELPTSRGGAAAAAPVRPMPEVVMTRNAVAIGLLLATVGLLPAPLEAQEPEWPTADPEDVASIDAIIAALYDVISGPAGEARDWDRFRSLHIPEARLIPTGRNETRGFVHFVWSVDEYIDQAGDFLEQSGFFETEIARETDRFGSIAQLFSTYESHRSEDDAEPFQRGINSIQLMYDGSRWWIVTIFWMGERDDAPIPERYLPPSP